MKIKYLVSCGAVLLGATLSSHGADMTDSSTPSARAGMAELSHADKTFFEKAAKSGMKEVDVSKSVQGRLTKPEVMSIASMMIGDHTAANTELMSLATKKGVTLPGHDMDVAETWNKKTSDLDEDYLKEMVGDHEDAIKLFKKASKSEDADIAAFAQKTLPTLEHHYDMVKSAKAALK